MKRMIQSIAWAVLVTVPALAEESRIEQLAFRECWTLDPLDAEDLKDHVVVAAFWDHRDPNCHRALPRLVRMYEQYREKGLVVVVIVCGSNKYKDATLALFREAKAPFTIYGYGSVESSSPQVPQSACVAVFEASGAMTYARSYEGLDKPLEAAMKGAFDWLAGSGKYVKVAAEAQAVRKRENMGQAANALREKAGSADPDERKEAGELLARLDSYADRALARADLLARSGSPQKALDLLKSLGAEFKGDSIGAKAAAAELDRTKTPEFRKELQAAKLLLKLQELLDAVDARQPEQPAKEWEQENESAIRKVRDLLKGIERSFGTTKVCSRAREMLAQRGL